MDYVEALERVRELVARYAANATEYGSAGSVYNETQLRVDYLNPLLECLGWDVNNSRGLPTYIRDVRQEFSLTGDENRGTRPDYTIRTFGNTKFFLEAKKPAVRIGSVDGPALQLRRYGWTETLPVSILSNFGEFAVYDCTVPPSEDDGLRTARLSYLTYDQYVDRFDELWRFSRESVVSGAFDDYYATPADGRLSEPFDQYFLRQLNEWRLILGNAVLAVSPRLPMTELNYVVQQLLNRILFLRIAEDRQLEDYEQLHAVRDFSDLIRLFSAAEARYDSGLFDFVIDTFTPTLDLPARAIADVLAGLYYPNSPFDFSVLDAATLGQVYEAFLGQRLAVADGALLIELAPEVKASQARGVVATPPSVVRRIVQMVVEECVEDRTVEDLLELRLLDMSCGSGPFLIAGYEFLMDRALDQLLELGEQAVVRPIEIGPGTWKLPFRLKRAILEACVRGVDLDLCAVELARFGLLLKLLEDVSPEELDEYLRETRGPALPNLDRAIIWGNSIVGTDFTEIYPDRADDDARMAAVRPMDWPSAFPLEMAAGGFDVILGNPPYVRIQNMAQYAVDEKDYLQNERSPLISAASGSPDKFYVFIERATGLLAHGGHAGFIVKNQFMYGSAASVLRGLITRRSSIRSITDFGTQAVFPQGRQVYTCIIHFARAEAAPLRVEEVQDVPYWVQGQPGRSFEIDSDRLGESPWLLAPQDVLAVFDKLYQGPRMTLSEVAPPFVGVQTSSDGIYILKDVRHAGSGQVQFVDEDRVSWTIESDLLRPVLYDQPLVPFSHVRSNAYILFPYAVGERATPITLEEMRAEYPLTLAYLESKRAQLENRSMNGGPVEAWYRYGRAQSLTRFDGRPKVIWPTLSTEPKYALDIANSVFTGGGNGPYYAFHSTEEHVDDRYLLAVMSHPVVDGLVMKMASSFRGDYASHGKEYVERIPIPALDPDSSTDMAIHEGIVRAVQAVIDLTDELTSGVTAFREQELRPLIARRRAAIEDVISDLYGLDAADLGTVANYLRQEVLEVEEG